MFSGANNQQSQDNKNDKDCSDCCSPFMSCNTCLGFTFPIANFFNTLYPHLFRQKVSIYKENTTSDFSLPFGNRPRLVNVSVPLAQ
ncbi:MAG: hypothetical protein IPN72_24600 [Saprospiraceae bacterium]|nr:hypothetical protein [Saprospiraceae bacterium]